MFLKIWSRFEVFRSDERAATAVEYGIIAAGIAVVTSAAIFAFGEDLRDMISDAGAKVEDRPE